MANLTSKLVIGGSIAIVLLMLFSAIPVAADTNEEGEIIVEEGEKASDPENRWTWDEVNCILTFVDDIEVFYIEASASSSPLTVHVGSNVTVKGNEHSCVSFESRGITVDGGGTLSIDGSLSMDAYPGNNAVLENISVDINHTGEDNSVIECKSGNLVIKDCPSIKYKSVVTDEFNGPAIDVGSGSLAISNTNLEMNITLPAGQESNPSKLIGAKNGMTMPVEPSGNLNFSNGYEDEESSDGWSSGTTQLIYSKGVVSPSLTMESYVPADDPGDGNLPIYVGVALLVIVIVAVGMYVAFKS